MEALFKLNRGRTTKGKLLLSLLARYDGHI